ncbi:two-component histidine kinase EvgS [Acinetobacter guillouiae]|uniref:transporter substrate-binding domain-containing protein n=1 Tax=Acinetobacter guillouiae TaxID=106649 RepID=UPI0004EF5D27|nr:transporter substrate-binding domain-containing protein [Acinetobacter guillouiae]BAP36421.1 two-component histidine kinase EvgS [Acinetobacter guillouiae]
MAKDPELMQIFSRERFPPLKFDLNSDDWRWLGKKQEINVAIYLPAKPPFDLESERGTVEGIAADYSLLIARSLGQYMKVQRYSDRDTALNALNSGEVDLMVDYRPNKDQNFIESQPLTPSYNALVARDVSLSNTQKIPSNARIAVLKGYLTDEWVTQHYSHAKITRYANSSVALSSVAFGENDYFIGNLTEASFFVERSYSNVLSIIDVLPTSETKGLHFLFRANDTQLQRIVNTVLKTISLVQHQEITSQWSLGEDIWRAQSSFVLTENEKRWLAQNKELRVVINPLYAPYTMLDAKGKSHGIGIDILHLIHVRTGINFNVITAESPSQMFKMISQKKADFIASMSYSDIRAKHVLFTRPYVEPPFVLIVHDKAGAPKNLSEIKSLAIVPDHALWGWIKEKYPRIKLVKATTASLAMQKVKENEVDGAVQNLISANYIIDRYFRGDLKIATQISDQSAQMAFAVGRDNPELYSILNKVLSDIAPRDISIIANKWQGTPEVNLDTWVEYRREFYWLTGIFLVLVLTSLFWNYYLRREIKKRNLVQTQLKEQVVFRETLFNSMLVPIYVVNAQGIVLEHNQAWGKFFKSDLEQIKNTPLTSPTHPLYEIYPTLQDIFNHVQDGPLYKHQYNIYNGEETRIIQHQMVPYVDIHEKINGVICSWQDITKQEYLLTELSTARERAEQANRSKTTFLATMSHEIRTPISAIIGLLELIVTNKNFSHSDMNTVQVAYESAQSLMGLIGDILDMAKIEFGALTLDTQWTPVQELITPVVRVFDGLALQKNLTLYCHIDILHPDEINIDALRLHQILSNLVSNAIKFTEQGSVEVLVKFLDRKEDTINLQLNVTDTGVGISLEDQQQIFVPYRQAAAGKLQTGTGLGLAICSQLVEMMGGTIHMQSQLGKGTQITIDIPVEHRVSTHPIVVDKTEFSISSQSLYILAVDDHPANRLLLKSQLIRLGHTVVEAENGDQALQLFRKHDFNLVITDCNMPVMDGLTLTKLLRQEQCGALTIFGLTANAQAEERARCLEAGMDECLFKPLRLAQLENLLNQVDRNSSVNQISQILLEHLIDLEKLNQLVQNDNDLLIQLLVTTKNENIQDLKQVSQFMVQEDYIALGRCFHRLVGAAQIIGASEIERCSSELESYCDKQVGFEEFQIKIQYLIQVVTQFNQAVDDFINGY